ncbi:MAG: uracil-DNA glycosylase [archaeon]
MDTHSLHSRIIACTLCPLSNGRTHAVPGEGPQSPRVMLIGEAPGRNEDVHGKPFCGAAGKKLDGLLSHAGLRREDVFITSVVKCRPPENRVPAPEEALTCKTHYLFPQIQLLKPAIIGLMGRTAIQHVLGEDISLPQMHGKIIERGGQKYAILYHPAAMIYNQSLTATMMSDFLSLKG